MKPSLTCLLCSDSDAWASGMRDGLADLVAVRQVLPDRLSSELDQQPSSLLLLDLQTPGVFDQLARIGTTWPNVLTIAFGVPGSDPFIEAQRAGLHAVEDASAPRRQLAALVERALAYLTVSEDNRRLRTETSRLTALAEATLARPPKSSATGLNVSDFSAALRHFSNVEALLHRLADEAGSTLRVSRVGIFCRTRDGEHYRLRAGVRCVENTASLEFEDAHPLVRWLKLRAHVVTRANLNHVTDPSARLVLSQTLDQLGAEILVPLQSRERLLGWLYVGHLATGIPFEQSHIENLITLTDCVSTTLENALLYEEVTIQKTLAETLLHALPTGIVAVDSDGIIRWYNQAARTMLGVAADAAVGRPVEGLGSRLSDILRRTLGEGGAPRNSEWTELSTRRSLAVRTERLTNATHCLGAVAVIQDTTDQKALKEKEERLDRATFWAELAASMSHEVRNPLVAIRTFAQLLPERFEDKEFQTEFKDLVFTEVDRLNSIIDQINDYAHPPAMQPAPVDIVPCVETSLDAVLPADRRNGHRVQISTDASIPPVQGDARALDEAFRHILRNALEAVERQPHPEISILLRSTRDSSGRQSVVIVFKDNGPGIPADLLGKVFSPFCTTKARGLGLGLPIARRTIMDHNGQITVHSNELGTSVTVILPASDRKEPPA